MRRSLRILSKTNWKTTDRVPGIGGSGVRKDAFAGKTPGKAVMSSMIVGTVSGSGVMILVIIAKITAIAEGIVARII